MKAGILPCHPGDECCFVEGCHIIALPNSVGDPTISIARVRVESGVTTRLQ